MLTSKKALTRHRIMRAARIVYEENGIKNANFSDIAKAAQVSRSTVFNHFTSSSDLLTALCGQEIEDLEKAYLEKGVRGKEGIISIFDTFIEDTAKYPQLVTQIIFSAITSGDEHNPLQMIEALLAKNLDDAEEETIMLLMGAYYGLITHYHLYNQPFDSNKMKAEMRRMIDSII